MMRTARGKSGCAPCALDFMEAERIAIEIGHEFQIGNVEDDVAKFLDLHMGGL